MLSTDSEHLMEPNPDLKTLEAILTHTIKMQELAKVLSALSGQNTQFREGILRLYRVASDKLS